MTILQTTVSDSGDEVLDFVDESVRMLQDEGLEPRYVIVGMEAYPALCRAISRRFGRGKGVFESYQWLPIVVDPYRTNEVCVVPGPGSMSGGVRTEQR